MQRRPTDDVADVENVDKVLAQKSAANGSRRQNFRDVFRSNATVLGKINTLL